MNLRHWVPITLLLLNRQSILNFMNTFVSYRDLFCHTLSWDLVADFPLVWHWHHGPGDSTIIHLPSAHQLDWFPMDHHYEELLHLLRQLDHPTLQWGCHLGGLYQNHLNQHESGSRALLNFLKVKFRTHQSSLNFVFTLKNWKNKIARFFPEIFHCVAIYLS